MPQPRTRGDWLWLVLIGLVAGFLSGLFGVGGGVLLVPALIGLLRFDIRKAAGTSLAAIVPTTVVGVIAYVLNDAVDWVAAALLAAGSIVGAQLGSHLLSRLPRAALRWGFIVFIVVVIVSLFLVIPSRDATIDLTIGVVVGIVALGLLTGILSGLLGIGGGAVVVPMLILLFGASDLVAKGTSLAMMIPTALSGTFANMRRHNVDLSAAAVIGISACATTAFGAIAAAAVPPFVGNVLFAAFLAFIAVRMTVEAIRRPR
ncbi:sulfite exporter TauE/SafE family protein [Glaciibacter superstes]|uniref:sulfite exporter TauE/SafE family protein n=1 Tax=Glaciibacter superstes TaxID=501023 RepID=UPI0003B467AF|nr:sulfite exporter TauE/SafE family protein [Glaciibacter superstes]